MRPHIALVDEVHARMRKYIHTALSILKDWARGKPWRWAERQVSVNHRHFKLVDAEFPGWVVVRRRAAAMCSPTASAKANADFVKTFGCCPVGWRQ